MPNYFVKGIHILNDTREIANAFNDYFINVGPSLANKIESKDIQRSAGDNIQPNLKSLFLRATDEREIIEVVHKFQNKRSKDCFDIDMELLKNIINYIATPLAYICNQSFLTGIFPSKMKIAKVIPIFKSNDSHQFINYRPISLLPQLSKILEKLFVIRLDNFIDKHNLLSEHQYGFRSKRSTSMAIMKFLHNVSTAIDKKEHTAGVFLDLSKAFDTIDHELLLIKMEKYGVRGTALFWLKSYLQDRHQYVQVNNVKSDYRIMTHGVPQGSVLGPKLFIMYINDVCEAVDKLSCILFADDTSLYLSGQDMKQLQRSIEDGLSRIKSWFDINKLSVNLNKTKYIIFTNRKVTNQIDIKINNIVLERVTEHKFLGICIDEKINWKTQICVLQTKLAKIVAVMNKMKMFLNQKSLYLLYNSLFLPYLNYCVEIWGNTYKSNINKIYLLQKKAIRIANKVNYTASTNSLFVKQKALKFFDLVELNTAVVMYKAYNFMLRLVSRSSLSRERVSITSEEQVCSKQLRLEQIKKVFVFLLEVLEYGIS